MKTLMEIIDLSWLDFLQRTRSVGFPLIMGLSAIVGVSFIATSNATSIFQTMVFDGYRGLYNSAWIGVLAAMLTSFCFILYGFYIIKDGISRDVKSGILELLSSTSVSKSKYLGSKVLSNIFLLSSIALFTLFVGIIMQFVQGEDNLLNLWCYIEPFLLITFPVILFISNLTLIFELIPYLANTLGNVVYFFVSMAGILVGFTQSNPYLDLVGSSVVFPQIIQVIKDDYPEYGGAWTFIGNSGFRDVEPLLWEGLSWTGKMLFWRTAWVLIAGGLFLTAIVAFNTFYKNGRIGDLRLYREREKDQLLVLDEQKKQYQVLPKTPTDKKNLVSLLFVEIKSSLKRMSNTWYLVAGCILLLSVIVEVQKAYNLLLPLAWLLPIGIWSQQGIMMGYSDSNQIMYSTVNAIPWHSIAEYLAGFLIALVFASPIVIRLTLSGHWESVFFIMIGSIFIVALAFFLGFWLKTSRAFEIVYLVLWYSGLFQKTGYLDFTGAAPEIEKGLFLLIYFSLSLAMILSIVLFKAKKCLD